jgi:hemerythrin
MLLEWSDRFSVDIVEVDAEHHQIFDLYNAFHEAVADPAATPRRAAALAALIAFFEHHAATEGRIMLMSAYDGFTRHDEEHRRFRAELHDARDSAAAGRFVIGPSTAGFVRDWLLDHIENFDKPLYEALNPDQVTEARRLMARATP